MAKSESNERRVLMLVETDKLDLLPFQSRLQIEGESFQDLVNNISENGVLEPLLVREKQNGHYEVLAGGRRLRAAQKLELKEVPVHVLEADDDKALDIHFIENLHRADLTEEEKRTGLGNYARIRKLNATQISERLGMSYSWVVTYLPEEFKDKKMVDLGRKGGEAKAATSLVPNQVSQESIECEGCGISTSEPEPWNHPQTGPHSLCKECHRKATLNPDPYLAKFRKHLEIEKKLTPNGNGTTTVEKVKDTWAYRESKMHPETSEMEEFILQKFSESPYRPVQHHREIVLVSAFPDFYLSGRNVIFELDGPVHEGREEKDLRLADMMQKRTGAAVYRIAYKTKTQEEKARVWNKIVRILENGKA